LLMCAMRVNTSYSKRQCKTKRYTLGNKKMEYNEVDLENICQEKLGWPAHKVARTRPVEMRAAIAEFEEEEDAKAAAVVATSNEEETVVLAEPSNDTPAIAGVPSIPTETKTPPPTVGSTSCVATDTPNVMLFSRRKRFADHAPGTTSTPLLTPMPTRNVTVMRPFMVVPPPKHLNKVTTSPMLASGSKGDIERSIDLLVRRHAKFTKQLQEKLDLMQSLKDEMDLEERLVLETSTKYTTNRLDRTTVSIMHMKKQIRQSIDRKKKLLAVATESDDEDDKDENLDESDKRGQIEHMQRVATILAKIDALESVLHRLDV
jgi:predicted transcriptional regulator